MSIVRIQFNDDLDDLSLPDKSAFSITDSSDTRTVTQIAISVRHIELQVIPFIQPGLVTVDYQKPDSKPISNRIGNRVDSFNQQFSVYDDKPALLSFTVDGDSLVLTYDEELDIGSVPDISSFTVEVEVIS